jgi:nucleotidyltransferase/DNA polymerase involved in DNA repair
MTRPQQKHRWIAHMDLDAFFASCEQQEDNKRLLKTIDAVAEKFGKHLLQVGVSRKPGK